MLTIVPTPIGNLKDVTLRALEVLKEVSGVICEDSRRASLLLNHYQIQKPLVVLNDFNETKVYPQIIEKLKNGENLALISDAGTPLISDPGFKLVRECLHQNIPVDSLPGASSILPALTLSGLPPDKFIFLGYPPDKPGHRQNLYRQIKEMSETLNATLILFIAPFKLIKTLEELKESLGDVEITLAKELTKIHQKVEGKLISSWLDEFKKQNPKGEWVLLFRL
ncbi:16S rRNA (cytidine(1402)-2'-O)-methyltransferase [Candidatus Daviesbacteria bacterium]|nr:16S rRNA (cytidine(1402)-2'-O)-methyltransferase [Candidatus Daviesbacteria bacterium]